MAMRIHHLAPMPKRRAPAAPVGMGSIGVEDEPAALHFCDSEFLAPAARHLPEIERQIHMLRCVAVEIIDIERAMAGREVAGGVSVRPAEFPAAAGATRRLETAGRTNAALIFRPITPALGRLKSSIVCGAHAFDSNVWRDALRKIEAIVRLLEFTGAGAFPLMRVAYSLAFGFAHLRRLARLDPNHRVGTGHVRIFKLVDASLGFLRGGLFRVIKRCHIFGAADLLKSRIRIGDMLLL